MPAGTRNADSIDRLRESLSAVDGIVAAYVFGSVARGTDKPASDLDVGLLYDTAPQSTLENRPFRLEAELGQQLERPVQLVVMNDAPVDLVHRILRDGILLFDKSPSRRIAFEVRSRNAYFDLLPILERYRRPRAAS